VEIWRTNDNKEAANVTSKHLRTADWGIAAQREHVRLSIRHTIRIITGEAKVAKQGQSSEQQRQRVGLL